MPAIFEAQCVRCGCKGHRSPVGYSAVFLDEPFKAESTPREGEICQHRSNLKAIYADSVDHRMLVLAHPGEERILKEIGYTWDTAKKAGRLVTTREVVCECGQIFKVRKLTGPSPLGCLGACFLGAGALIASFALGFWMKSFWFALGGFWAFSWIYTFAEEVYGNWYLGRFYRARVQAIDGPSCCPRCTSKNFVGIARGRIFPCPHCGEKTMRFLAVAKS